jgi:hypothetical protein
MTTVSCQCNSIKPAPQWVGFDKKTEECFHAAMDRSTKHIIGAGPAGLCAAIALARAGCEVHVHERYDTVGKRFQGDLQGLENWSCQEDVLDTLRSFGLSVNFEATPFYDVTLTDGKSSIQGSSKEPLFYLVKRGTMPESLDSGLCRQALEHDVQIHYRSSFTLESADIIATGPIRESIIAADKGIVFPSELPNMAVGIFHDDLAYLGYSYLLVSNGYGCLCTVVFKDLHRLNECFERTVEAAKKLYTLNLDKAHPVGGVGSFSLDHPVMLGNARLAGEAGGFQDLLWGFGIRTALTSGYYAARSCLDGQDYSAMIKNGLQPGLKASIVNRFLWETLKLNSRPLIPMMMRLPMALRTSFRFLYSFSPFHKMLYPFALRYIQKQYPHSIEADRK